jgi:hypothetical protein
MDMQALAALPFFVRSDACYNPIFTGQTFQMSEQ